MRKSNNGPATSCWCCGSPRSAVTLKIIGTERRLCDDCRLMADQDVELEGRLRELFGYMTWEGFVPNKHRRKVDLLLRHRYRKVSALAEEMLAEDDFQNRLSTARREHDSNSLQRIEQQYERWIDGRIDRLGETIAERFG